MPSVKSLGLLLALALGCATAAPRKAGARSPSAGKGLPAAPAPETVYVQVTQPRESPRPPPEAREPFREPETRRSGATGSGGFKDYGKAYGLYTGFYAAELLGSNPYANFFCDLYPPSQAFFFEFTSGVGLVQSEFSRLKIGGQYFKNDYLVTFEALAAYSLSRQARGEGRNSGLFPYLTAGLAAVYQGGVPNIGAVLGFGNRMALPWGRKSSLWALNYGARDHIYSQKLQSTPTLTQNFILVLGVQKYY